MFQTKSEVEGHLQPEGKWWIFGRRRPTIPAGLHLELQEKEVLEESTLHNGKLPWPKLECKPRPLKLRPLRGGSSKHPHLLRLREKSPSLHCRLRGLSRGKTFLAPKFLCCYNRLENCRTQQMATNDNDHDSTPPPPPPPPRQVNLNLKSTAAAEMGHQELKGIQSLSAEEKEQIGKLAPSVFKNFDTSR